MPHTVVKSLLLQFRMILVPLLFALFPISGVNGVLQAYQLDVYLGGVADATSLSSPSYTFLASQAFFGIAPRMGNNKNPIQNVALPPSNNPLLCNNVTASSTTVSSLSSLYAENTLLLVPRGECTFEIKAYHAQLLGAEAVIVYGTLASRYTLNTTSRTSDHTYTTKDVLYPLDKFDYDCSLGQAQIPKSALDWTTLPYNSQHNDPVLSENTSHNLCMTLSTDHLSQCPSRSCLLTGRTTASNSATTSSLNRKDNHNDNTDSSTVEACCAWDLPIWLFPDTVAFNGTHYSHAPTVTIPAAYLTMEQSVQLLQDLNDYGTIQVILSDRWRSEYNTSSYLIWALGVTVAAVAACCSASEYHTVIRRIRKRRSEGGDRSSSSGRRRTAAAQNHGLSNTTPRPEESVELTAWHALGFIAMATTSLLILFYLKIYNVVKVMYALGCSRAVSQVIFDPILCHIQRHFKKRNLVVWRTNTEEFGDITLRDIVSAIMGYAWGISWLILAFTHRHPDAIPFFWITQDIFGACMCIMFLQVIKLNSIQVASTLLIVAFFYDIFFVFVSPLLFNKSVMITVATSGGPPIADELWCEKYPSDKNCQGGDPLPMLFTIPRVGDYMGGASMLGLGDIVLPGLLLSFGARLDASKSLLGILGGGHGRLQHPHACPERRYCGHCVLCSCGYFPPLVVAYAIGLFMANAAVYIMNMGQPALLYLVPCCLGTITFMGWRRGELLDLWHGPKSIRAADDILYGTESTSSSSSDSNHVLPVPTDDDDDDDNEVGGLAGATFVPSALDYEDAAAAAVNKGEKGDVALLPK